VSGAVAAREYRVLPAPTRGRKAPGVKTPEGRFALGLEDMLNEMARDGWRYVRSDILPSEERQGLTSTTTVYRSVLVFERSLAPPPLPSGPPEPEPEREVMAEDIARSLSPDRSDT
jgi:hypothetical protein